MIFLGMKKEMAEQVKFALHAGDFKKPFRAALFDMDGVLYDSMPRHARAWMAMCRRNGLKAQPEEFFAWEGRTGASTIDILMMRQHGRHATTDEVKALYGIKSAIFRTFPSLPPMYGAREAVDTVVASGCPAVLVTGSGQESLLDKVAYDFPGAFLPGQRVTALDVKCGKPDPEPYLMGARKAGVSPRLCVAVDNAPLGVESAHKAGCFTIGVRTGPLAPGCLLEAGADIEIEDMEQCNFLLSLLF